MVRIVNEATYKARRNAILEAALRIVEARGYEQMAIADILSELHISSGAFYHYFDSKPALLEALIEHIGEKRVPLILPIISDPKLSALDKLQRFFATLNEDKIAKKHLVLTFARIWYADENSIVRHKLYLARIKSYTPWLEAIINQGVNEGIFTAPYPDQTARMIVSLLEDVGNATVDLLLTQPLLPDDLSRLERIIIASADAIERVTGAPADCLQETARAGLSLWLAQSTQKQEEAEQEIRA